MRCARCKHVFQVRPPRPRILVAKDDKEFHLRVQELLRDQPFDLLFAEDGVNALEIIQQDHPVLVILDVALPRIYGFELAEILRSEPHTSAIRIILLAAVHDKTRYKRLPESLYGADTYIEAHHITDKLLPKIKSLLPDLFTGKRGSGAAAVHEQGIEKPAPGEPGGAEVMKRAKRLARIILSDIALYNQEKVEEGIRNGDFQERLALELKEAEEMMEKRFPEFSLKQCQDLLRREIASFMRSHVAAPRVS